MDKNHIEKLNKLLEVVKIVEATQKEVMKNETEILIKEIKGKFEYLVDKHFIDIDNKAENILSEAQNYVLSVFNEQKLLRTEIDENSGKISNLQELIDNIEMPVFDVETFEKNVLEKIPVYEIPNTEDIVTGINLLPIIEENQIDASHIKNLPKLVSQISGGRGVKAISNSNVKITEIAKSINFTGTAISSITTDNNGNVTVGITSGGNPLFGTAYTIPYFNATGNDLDTNPNIYYDVTNDSVNITSSNLTNQGAIQIETQSGNVLARYVHQTGIIVKYLLSDTAPTLGLAAEIGSWASDNVNFYIKYGSGNTNWGIPLLYRPLTGRIENPLTAGGDISFLTSNGFFEAGDLSDATDGMKINIGFSQVNLGDLNGLINGTSFFLDDSAGTVSFAYGTGAPVVTTTFNASLIDTDTDIRADHYRGKTGVPTIAAGIGAGTGPTVGVTGNDFKHTVNIRTGTTPTAGGVIATVTFDKAWTSTNNNPVFSAQDANASLWYTEIYMVRTSTTTYDIIDAGSGLQPLLTYTWSVICGE
jgi:hypothetical protein